MSAYTAYEFMAPYLTIPILFMEYLTVSFIVIYICFGWLFSVFLRLYRYIGLQDIRAIFLTTTCTAILNFIFLFILIGEFSRRFVLLTYLVSTILIVMSRVTWRLVIQIGQYEKISPNQVRRVIFIGAGEGGRVLYNAISTSQATSNIEVIGFVDDDINKQNIYISNAKVLGTIDDLPRLIVEKQVDLVTVTIPSLSNARLREIFELLKDCDVEIYTMPSVEKIVTGEVNLGKLEKIDIVDLLGRDEVKLDTTLIKQEIADKVILVTGAGGSIGSEICRQIIQFQPKQLLLLGHGENSIYQINQELCHNFSDYQSKITPLIADIQDRDRIFEIFKHYQPNLVYHAAAHKHVPLMELNPREAVKNNIFGTKNVAEAAKFYQAEHFVMVSTDKANNPPNVMGATKRIAEMIVTSLNESGKTIFSTTRFGNVLGSRGSVVPLFREQIAKGGPITLTDFRMTRYFMTIPEASRLVIQSGVLAKGGEIFVLDMGEPMKILDLAKNMIRLSGFSEYEIKIVETGIRPGEKLYEELLVDKERNDQQVYDKIFVGNIKGNALEAVMNFVIHLPTDDETLKKLVVKFANDSSR